MPVTGPVPLSFNLVVRAQVSTSRIQAEVHHYRWTQPQQRTFLNSRHFVDLVLSQRPSRAEGRFAAHDDARPRSIGPMMFVPGGAELEGRWDAGEQESVCCSIDEGLLIDEDGDAVPGIAGLLDVRDDFACVAMRRIARETLSPGFASGLLIEALCQALLVDLRRLPREAIPRARGLTRLQLARIDDMLRVDGPAPETADFARECGLSSRHFARLFQATQGKSVGTYAAEQRMAQAKALLATPSPMIKEIAWRCGFHNAAAFSSAFRRGTGLTPREYRRRLDL